ncbi:MAG: IS30 family transposase [Clostridiales Family XIII bacterium]|jgi:IS30 family transposase|nr:IS30 family transposase [Clostridiales Family XIII bacterium]
MQEKKYSRLTACERKSIEQSLKIRKSLCEIAKELGRSTSTVSREIVRNSIHKRTGGFGTEFNNCTHRDVCGEERLCSKEDCDRGYCCGCKFCFHVCKKYERELCPGLKLPPYVCNGCRKKSKCTLEKAFYKSKLADRSANDILKASRVGIDLDEEERQRLDRIVSPLIKKGQSPYHICVCNKDALMISDKTLYKYIAANLFAVTSTDLLRKVGMKRRRTKPQLKIETGCYVGRTYRDFLDHIETHSDTEVVQMDTVIGAKGADEKVLLTIHFPQSHLMLAFIRDANTARSVTEAFDRIKSMLGYDRFVEIFPLILTDRGSEFSNPSAIETDDDTGLLWTQIFYCDPYCSYQKAAIENNHKLIRMILKKGESMNGLTQDDIDMMMNHINSYRRKALGGKSPLEMFIDMYGNKMGKLLGLRLIPTNEITLDPSLLK